MVDIITKGNTVNRRQGTAAGMIAAFALAAVLTGCQSGTSNDAGADASQVDTSTDSITIIHAPVNYEVAYIAENEGFFEEVGLDVTVKPGGTPQDNMAQVMGGSADLAIVSWDTLVTASAEGIPIQGVASAGVVSSTNDTSGILVSADSDIQSVQDLTGKQVAFSDLGGGPHVVAQQAFIENNMDPETLKAVRIPFASMQASLESNQIDAAYPSDSFYSQMANDPQFRVIANPTREFRAGLPVTIWAASEQWLAERPETAAKFIEAMELATDFYNDEANHDAIINIRTQVSEISPEQAEAMQTEFSVTVPLGVTQNVSDALVKLGAVKNGDKVKPSRELVWEGAVVSD